MKRVLAILVLPAALVACAVVDAVATHPEPVPTAVLGAKPSRLLGGQGAVLLPPNLSAKQYDLLRFAYQVAVADGHRDPALVQGVLLQESEAATGAGYRVAGTAASPYFGAMQLKLPTAREVLASYPGLYAKYGLQTRTDDEVKANLILNDRFNVEVGSKYLRLLSLRYGLTGTRLVNAYNRGPGGVEAVGDDYHYGLGVAAKAARLKGLRLGAPT
jgi:hypothetical protein